MTVMSGMIAAMFLITLMTPLLYVIIQSLRERRGNRGSEPDLATEPASP